MRICLWLAGGLAAAGMWGPAGAWGPVARAQFAMQDSTVTADLRGIAAVGDGVAWASGTRGTVLRTEDGGFVWQGCAMPPGAEALDFRGVQALDGQTALVMSSGTGKLSRVYKTVDGCRSWKMVLENPDAAGFFDAISFSRSELQTGRGWPGVLIGDPVGGKFRIFTTTDSGSSWTSFERSLPSMKVKAPLAKRDETLFAASNQALGLWFGESFLFVTGGGAGSRIFFTEGSTICQELGVRCTFRMSEQILPGFPINASSGAFAFASTNRSNYFPFQIMVVGGDYQHPERTDGTAVFLSSRNVLTLPSTRAFNLQAPLVPPHGYRSSVVYEAGSKSWLTVGPNGTDVSIDDGKHWRALRPGAGDAADADRGWNALSLPFVVGPHGRIGRLREGVLGGADAK